MLVSVTVSVVRPPYRGVRGGYGGMESRGRSEAAP